MAFFLMGSNAVGDSSSRSTSDLGSTRGGGGGNSETKGGSLSGGSAFSRPLYFLLLPGGVFTSALDVTLAFSDNLTGDV